jgi:hypothetical protein
MDLIWLGGLIAFFAASLLLIRLCASLLGEE